MRMKQQDTTIEEITFEEIIPYWNNLWPKRVSVIEPVSCINIDSEIDVSIKKFKPKFYAARSTLRSNGPTPLKTGEAGNGGSNSHKNIMGVISSHKTSDDLIRLRGLYVEEAFRGQGVSRHLISRVLQEARRDVQRAGITSVWALVRTHNAALFEKFSFVKKNPLTVMSLAPIMLWCVAAYSEIGCILGLNLELPQDILANLYIGKLFGF